jgi:hypothetical protein
VESFDAGQGFVHLVDGLRHVAHHAGAELRGEGPANFVVQGDDERVRRLGTHLVFCALRSSRPGVVQVSWGALEGEPARWFLAVEHAVQEGGRGASSDAGRALARATDAAQQSEGVAPTGDEAALQEGVIPVAQGDGVNLLIAKHLCELLGAGLEVEAEADAGVLRYRASLPMAYGPT